MAKNDSQIKALVNDLFLFGDGSFDQFAVEDLFSLLVAADEAYTNGKPLIDDTQYDALYRYVEVTDPGNNYFYGVGSQVRGGKIKLPFTMGSLTQAYEGDFTKWVAQHDLKDENLIVTEKLDGISALIVYDNSGKLQIAYSRGDGIEGADITRHVSKIKSLPKNVGQAMTVRAEIIFSKADWEIVKTKIKRSGGAYYKNARNCVAGLMNASESDPVAYQYLHVVAYEILAFGSDDTLTTGVGKESQLTTLVSKKFIYPRSSMIKGKQATDAFLTDALQKYRDETDYEIDGIVIDVDNARKRKNMTSSRSTLNPEFARKFKIADASNMAIARVVEVQWNISKNGYLKPRVKIEPTELVGVTVQHATGFNAKFISDNDIGPGAMIRITRSGDVIPFIVGVVSPAVTPKPYSIWFVDELSAIGDWKWSPNHVDAILENAEDNETVQLEQLIDFFGKVGTEYLGEGNLQTIFDAGFKTIVDVINLSEFEWVNMIGANGKKIYKSIREKLKNVPWYIVAGAHPAFGRGVGVRKMKKLYDAFAGDMRNLGLVAKIVAVEGFETKTATKIAYGYQTFIKFMTDTDATITFAKYEAPKGGDLSGESFLFTGFRDKGLEKTIEEKGGKIASSVSSKLTYLVALDPSEDSGKLKKARELGTKIISRDQLVAILS